MKLSQKKGPSVAGQLSSQILEQQAVRRACFMIQLSSLKMLLRQGLAIRGHTEEEGNLQQLLRLRMEDNPDLKMWIANGDYMSSDIINECITLMGHSVLRSVLNDVKVARYYAIMADETRDIDNKEQLALCVRWVDEEFVIHEDLIGMVHVEKTDANSLTAAIKDVLLRCSLPMVLCKGQAYDGAAAMMGHLRGVAAQLRRENPSAIPVHCFAHSLNLCLQDAASSNRLVRDVLSLIQEMCQLICNSPKRHLVFVQLKQHMSPDALGLRPLCPTRWTVRTRALESVIDNYATLVETFTEISETSNDEYGRRAAGVLAQLEKFETFFGMKLCHLVFAATEEVSRALQRVDMTLGEGLKQAEVAKEYLTRQRTDSAFKFFFEQTKRLSTDLTDEPALPRQRRLPKRLDSGSAAHVFQDPMDYLRKTYYEMLDKVIQELDRRFQQRDMELPRKTEDLLLQAANWEGPGSPQVPDLVLTTYKEDLNGEKLHHQLAMLPDLVRQTKVKKVTSVRSLAQILTSSKVGVTSLFSEVSALVRLFMTLPVTTATAERSFSTLRRLKTYLRSTMTQQRLNNVLMTHCHKSVTDNIDIEAVAKMFICVNETRMRFFGSFPN